MEQCRAAAASLAYDPAAAAGLEEEAERQRGEVRRWKDRCDELSSLLLVVLAVGVARVGGVWREGRWAGALVRWWLRRCCKRWVLGSKA